MTKKETVRKIEEDVYEIQSHSNESIWYRINVKNSACSCPHWKFRLAKMGGQCKHYKDLMEYFDDIKDNRQGVFDEIMDIIRETPFSESFSIIEKYGDEVIDEMIQLGMLIESRGKLRVLE